MTFLVNTHRNHRGGSTSRSGLVTMLSLVLLAKVGAMLLTGVAAVPGGLARHSTQPTVGTSWSGLPIDAGHYSLTPLGTVWSRIIDWLRNRTATASDDDPQAKDEAAAAAAPAYPKAEPPDEPATAR